MNSQTLQIYISPCPNDTFLFYPFLHNCIDHPFQVEAHFLDIEELNQKALTFEPDLIKVSFAMLPLLQDRYTLLRVGAAVGFGNGPKLVSKKDSPSIDISRARVGIPGIHTTAYRLLKTLFPPAREEHFGLYHEIPQWIREEKVDMGLIIHETRFTLEELGLCEVWDLGQLWERKTSLPLPLGCLVGKKSLGVSTLQQITDSLQRSLRYAWDHPDEGSDFILSKSQEKNPSVIQSHIKLYVNDWTYELSTEVQQAIDKLLGHAPV